MVVLPQPDWVPANNAIFIVVDKNHSYQNHHPFESSGSSSLGLKFFGILGFLAVLRRTKVPPKTKQIANIIKPIANIMLPIPKIKNTQSIQFYH